MEQVFLVLIAVFASQICNAQGKITDGELQVIMEKSAPVVSRAHPFVILQALQAVATDPPPEKFCSDMAKLAGRVDL